ncbi:hypothetical protein [Devosia sediminis]|uniref:Uncharacterized protein n=1 Tax=Devosia sediminis TaxID=2798801 RepID=A0A934IQ72_9HYPH|nr:hypothetical protein [Devosia sediminis]MBJ3784809.1 hypothetical protein [Devosia sediminis]
MAAIAAIVFTILMAGLAVFQLALALGAPLGHFAWGGQHRVLPRGLRMGSLVAIPLYGLFSAIMLMRAGVMAAWPDAGWIGPAAWAVVAYMGLGVLVNGISRSLPERFTMTPLAGILFALALTVVLG